MGKRYVVIPAYEPGENLPALVSEVAAAGLDPVVVDDGSGQGYREIFEQVTAEGTVLHHEENKGKGQALKTAFFYIKNNEAENGDDFFVVTMDSDGQHTVADALKLLKAAEKEPQTLILGSRALKKGTPSWICRCLRRFRHCLPDTFRHPLPLPMFWRGAFLPLPITRSTGKWSLRAVRAPSNLPRSIFCWRLRS